MHGGALKWVFVSLALGASVVSAADPAEAPVSEGFRAAVQAHRVNATDADHAGIWKAATPAAGTAHGEFGNNDPIGLSAGVRIWADCSINWIDPNTGRRYCFSSATSLVVFLERPESYLASARGYWERQPSAPSASPGH
jgi:hypothetical protein